MTHPFDPYGRVLGSLACDSCGHMYLLSRIQLINMKARGPRKGEPGIDQDGAVCQPALVGIVHCHVQGLSDSRWNVRMKQSGKGFLLLVFRCSAVSFAESEQALGRFIVHV